MVLFHGEPKWLKKNVKIFSKCFHKRKRSHILLTLVFYPASTGRAGMCSYLAENKVPAFCRRGWRVRRLHMLIRALTERLSISTSKKPFLYIAISISHYLEPLISKAPNYPLQSKTQLIKKNKQPETFQSTGRSETFQHKHTVLAKLILIIFAAIFWSYRLYLETIKWPEQLEPFECSRTSTRRAADRHVVAVRGKIGAQAEPRIRLERAERPVDVIAVGENQTML